MAELLIQWSDKLLSNDPLYSKNYKAGDVIAVCPDGWVWSDRERTNPKWRILKLPGVNPDELTRMTSPRVNPVDGDIQQRRDVYIDKARLQGRDRDSLQSRQEVELPARTRIEFDSWTGKR